MNIGKSIVKRLGILLAAVIGLPILAGIFILMIGIMIPLMILGAIVSVFICSDDQLDFAIKDFIEDDGASDYIYD